MIAGFRGGPLRARLMSWLIGCLSGAGMSRRGLLLCLPGCWLGGGPRGMGGADGGRAEMRRFLLGRLWCWCMDWAGAAKASC